jgi:phospholipid/cholesterol/gamma-HCH transport system substrate-binding protein
MGRRANPTLIGAFLVGAVALVVIGILIFARGQFLTEKRTFVLYFDGSLKGLNVGAPVDFKGVRVGSVIDIRVEYLTKGDDFRIPVFIDIEPGRISQTGVRKTQEERLKFYSVLIERGLRAQLGTVSLVTGQLYVQLDFFPGTPVELVGADPDVPELPTIPTPLQQASQVAQDLLEKLQQLPLDQLFANVLGISQGLNQLVNAPETQGLVRSLSSTSTEVQDLVRHLDSRVGRLLDDLGGATTTAHSLLADAQQLVRRVDGQVVPLTTSVKETLDVTRAAVKDGQQLVRQVEGRIGPLMSGLTETSKVAQATMVHTQRMVDDKLVTALQEFTAAARSFRLLADYLERNPNALLYGKASDRR